MSIIRTCHNKSNPYTVINKKTLEMENLSWEAKGVWAYLMSRKDDWITRVSHLCKHFPGGIDRMRRILSELQEAGLAQRKPQRNEKGQWDSAGYEIYETPQEFKKCLPSPENPGTVNSGPENAGPYKVLSKISTENINKKISKEIQKEPANVSKSVAVTPSLSKISFGEFKRVKLTQEEFDDLEKRLGKPKLEDIIIAVDLWFEETGKTKKSHKATILNWARREKNFNPKAQIEDDFKKHKNGAEKLREMIFSRGCPKDFSMFCGTTYVEVGYNSHPNKQILKYDEKNFLTLLEHHLRKMNILSLLESQKCLH